LIIEEDAAPAIDLQIDKARSQKGAGGELRLRPVGWNLSRSPNSGDASISDQHSGLRMPAAAIKYTVSQNRMPTGD
jgi:hypothetical protein